MNPEWSTLQKENYSIFILRNLMHAVDWLPTLLAAVGQSDLAKELDGVDHWASFNSEWDNKKLLIDYFTQM